MRAERRAGNTRRSCGRRNPRLGGRADHGLFTVRRETSMTHARDSASKFRKRVKPRVTFGFSGGVPALEVSFSLEEALNASDIDERIGRLDSVKRDLEAALQAVAALKSDALDRKAEAEDLRTSVEQLKSEKYAAETLLQLPKDSVTNLLTSALAKVRVRGLIEGLLVGFLSGALSSALIWWLTT